MPGRRRLGEQGCLMGFELPTVEGPERGAVSANLFRWRRGLLGTARGQGHDRVPACGGFRRATGHGVS